MTSFTMMFVYLRYCLLFLFFLLLHTIDPPFSLFPFNQIRSILFHSILFYSIPFYSIPFCSILFHSILFHSIPSYTTLHYYILFYTILFYSIPFYSILLCSPLLHCILIHIRYPPFPPQLVYITSISLTTTATSTYIVAR